LLSSIDAGSVPRVVCIPAVLPAEAGLARLQAAADEITSESGAPALLIWRSQRALLVTRQDTHLPRFRDSSEQMAAAGWPVVLRKSGGGACPVGPGTIEVATIEPAIPAATINAKYEALSELIQSSLHSFAIAARSGPVTGAYCSGHYDLAVQGKKIAGLSQHWFRNRGGVRCVITAASVNVEEAPAALADAVNRFYSHAGSRVRCQTVALTAVRLCGGETLTTAGDLVRDVVSQLASLASTTSTARHQSRRQASYK
jgi:octanoyl-[GcvH]:protein N-octanoyltransferase